MTTRYLLIIAGAWIGLGLVVASWMKRRGHAFGVWLLLGVALGPLSVPLAIERARYHRKPDDDEHAIATPPRSGLDVLVGLDGSPDSERALDSIIALIGWDISSITLATVLDYDAEKAPSAASQRAEAQAMLDAVASRITIEPVHTTILYGPPAATLAEHARTSGMELIVTGARGRGATEALFGSVAGRLVGTSEVPVMVGPRATRRTRPA